MVYYFVCVVGAAGYMNFMCFASGKPHFITGLSSTLILIRAHEFGEHCGRPVLIYEYSAIISSNRVTSAVLEEQTSQITGCSENMMSIRQ